MEAKPKRKMSGRAAVVVSLALVVASGALLVQGCNSPMRGHGSPSKRAESGEVELLLGIHRFAGLLLGDAGLRTDLDLVWMQVNEPLVLQRTPSRSRSLVPGSKRTRGRMRKILESAFADRINVRSVGASGELQPATHALESTFSELKSEVKVKLRLLSLKDGSVAGKANGSISGADLSLVTKGDDDDDVVEAGESLEPVKSTVEPSVASEERLPAAPNAVRSSQVQLQLLERERAEDVPSWIYDLLSEYSEPE